MIGDIGMIVGIYTFLRLGVYLVPRTEDGGLPQWAKVAAFVGMGAIALLTIDIFSIGTGWLAEEVQAAQ